MHLVVFALGLLAGLFLGSALVEHAARVLPGPVWIAYKHAKEKVFGALMPPVFGLVLIACAVAAVLTWPDPPFAIAAVLLAGALAITVLVHVPLNKAFQAWSPTAQPPDWSDARRRWRTWNWARTALVAASFAVALI